MRTLWTHNLISAGGGIQRRTELVERGQGLLGSLHSARADGARGGGSSPEGRGPEHPARLRLEERRQARLF